MQYKATITTGTETSHAFASTDYSAVQGALNGLKDATQEGLIVVSRLYSNGEVIAYTSKLTKYIESIS